VIQFMNFHKISLYSNQKLVDFSIGDANCKSSDTMSNAPVYI
jgi:hypothetical protein